MVKTKTKVISVLLLITLLMSQFSVFAVSEEIVYDQNRISWYNSADGIGATMYKVQIADKYAYCIDYQYQIPVNGTVSDLNENKKLSTETLSVLKYGFPNVSYKELGVNSEEEAYVATQLAVWQVVSLKDNRHATNGFALTNLEEKEEYKDQATRALNAAKKLAEKALNNPVKPSISIDRSAANTTVEGSEFVAGPYKVNVVDTTVNSYKVSLSNNQAYVTDEAGNKVEGNEVKAGQTFYVRWPSTQNGSTMRISVSTIANISKAVVCVVSEKGLQSFGVEVTDEVTLTASTDVSWQTLVGKVQVTKIDQELNKVAGAVFALVDANGKTVATATTNSEGIAVFNNVKIGNYTVVETSAPAGYIKTDKTEAIEVTNENTTSVTVTNTKIYGNMQLVKIDDAGNKLSGVKFEIRDEKGNLVDEIVTNAEGVATTKTLAYGKYTYKEVAAPANVAMDTNAKAFNISENNKTIVITVVNQRIKGQLKIVKTEDLENKPLAGVKFEIRDENNKLVETITTDANGIAMTQKLLKGNYTYKEVSVPAGIIMDTKEYDFSITKNNEVVVKNIVNVRVKGGLKITKVDDESKPISGVKFEVRDENNKLVETITTDANGVASTKQLPFGKYTYEEVSAPVNVVMQAGRHTFEVVTNDKVVEVKVVNCLVKGTLQITKKDDAGKVLSGVKFEIRNAEGKLLETVTTNKDGVATTSKLVYGKYTYKEVAAPSNVVMDNQVKNFEITKSNQVVNVTVVNQRIKGMLQITKIDDEGNTLSGVKFEIRNAQKQVIAEVVTDENGVAKLENLLQGKYTYKEVSGKEGYLMDEKTYGFEIKDNKEAVEVKVINTRIFSSLRIVKTDDVENKPLAGVKFEIKDEDGKVVDEITTDEKGIATSKYLYAGKYTYKEVEVPEGIVIDEQEYPFEVVKHEEMIVKNIVNNKIKGTLRITKLEKGTQTPIAGVKFDIYDANGNRIEQVVTDEKGEAVSSELTYGKYYFQEVEAPEKYEIDTSKHDFEIVKDGLVIDSVVLNKLKELPVTGGLGTDNMIVLSVSALSILGYIAISKKRNAKNAENKQDNK